MSSVLTYKEKVKSSFSVKAPSYEEAANVQRHAAAELAKIILKEHPSLIEGRVLEIGSGTGFLSSDLATIFNDRPLTISDVSASMLLACSQKLSKHPLHKNNINFELIDAENIKEQNQYAVIASSFALQWLDDLSSGIGRLCKALKPGGSLFFSMPGERSFALWKDLCQQFDVPFTINPLASAELLTEIACRQNMVFKFKESVFLEHFSTSSALLQSLKDIGAATQRQGLVMNAGQLRRFMRTIDSLYPEGVSASYQLFYGQMIKR